jgi:ketosteroid isomerase-like protein
VTSANVELVGRALSAYEDDEEAWLEYLDPEIEWTPFEEGRPSVGREQAVRIRRQWLDTWEVHNLEVETLLASGNDVIATIHLIGRGKASDVPVDVRLYLVFSVQDGLITRIIEHTRPPEKGADPGA